VTDYPILDVLPAIREVLRQHPRLVLEAPPGAGKTTQVPLALLAEPWCEGRKLLMLEPRRVAARAAALFMAAQCQEAVGDTVGYRIRFENRVSAATRIEVVTEGILTRMLQDDPALEGVAGILFDEFHERHLASDLGLALALDVQQSLREDLRLVIMSATLDGERLADKVNARRISSSGRSYPVHIAHFPALRNEALPQQVRRCITQALERHPGDILVFLPGQREIFQVKPLLESLQRQDIDVQTLYGDMPLAQQTAALSPATGGRRRIVLATNLAESSLTLPGIRTVIDSGLAREPRFDPATGFSRLETVGIARDSADQRTGRAGRVADGWCYRLWSTGQALLPSRNPEIATVDLTGLALELAAWGNSDLAFVDPPPRGALAAGQDLLQRLDALDQQLRITPLGQRVLELGTHPRLAVMLLSATDDEDKALACDLAALMESRDPLSGERRDDWQSRWLALAAHRHSPQSLENGVSRAALDSIDQMAGQWRRRLGVRIQPPRHIDSAAIGALLCHAYPDRIAHGLAGDAGRYQLSNGRGARLPEGSPLRGEPWLVVSELRHEARDSLILRAAPVDENRLQREFPERFITEDAVRWDEDSRALLNRRETRFDQILLDSRPAGRPDPQQAAQALCDAVAGYGLDCLPWNDRLRQWQQRAVCLRNWMPELNLPDLDFPALLAARQQWLYPALLGKFRLDALQTDELAQALLSMLDWQQQQALERHSPTHVRVPSGLDRPISYAAGSNPVLSIKLQELFGLGETPRIAAGRIPLTLHLLSPGGKPLQVTQDLRSFWNTTYPEVKKEMKGRYPRHPWPDDPWNATATHRAKPRGT
jgi:ATP-dependent helicase HrpB